MSKKGDKFLVNKEREREKKLKALNLGTQKKSIEIKSDDNFIFLLQQIARVFFCVWKIFFPSRLMTSGNWENIKQSIGESFFGGWRGREKKPADTA